VLDAVSFWAGMAFIDAETVLPVLLARLGASDAQIGLIRLIVLLGFTLPALWAAHYIHGRPRHKPFLLACCAIGRGSLLLFPPLLLLYGETRPELVLWAFFGLYAVFWLTDGASAVSWFDIIAKTIPERVRGRFFGVMQTVGGLTSLASGGAVVLILRNEGLPFPKNFALLAACMCVGAAVSQLFLFLIREPEAVAVTVEEERPRFRDTLRQAGPLMRRNPRLRKLVTARLLLEGASLAAPFYVLFAERDLKVGLGMAGVYAAVKAAGKVGMGPVWGWISDRHSPRWGLAAVAAAVLMVPALALLSASGNAWLLPAAFFLQGAVQDGLWMTGSNTLLSAVSEGERPLAVGVVTVLQAPGALFGVAGGLIAQRTTYPTVFLLAALFAAAGLWVSLRLAREVESG
jgi:MFS family permease